MNQQNWYQELIKPSWAPPTEAFGIAWGIIYPIIFVSFGYVLYLFSQGKLSWQVALPFLLNILFNATFTYVQFGLKNQDLAMLWMLIILGTLIWGIVVIWPHSRWVALAQIPYVLWGTFATALQAFIWWNN